MPQVSGLACISGHAAITVRVSALLLVQLWAACWHPALLRDRRKAVWFGCSSSNSSIGCSASEARQAGGYCRGAVGKPRTPKGPSTGSVLWAGGLSTARAMSEDRSLVVGEPISVS